jgi:hypothetical protein
MADLKLKRICLRNWEKIRSAEVVFPDRGLVLIIGSNLAAKGKLQSVGAGKTSLGEALSRALTGVPGRYKELGHYAPDSSPKDLLVTVEAELLGKPLCVTMGYKTKELSATGEGLRFEYDGRKISRGHVDQTREELCRTLRITPELANWTVFLDGDRMRFNRLSQEDSVNLLMTALAQPIGEYHERANRVLLSAQRQTAAARQALEMAKLRQDKARINLENAQLDFEDAQKDYQSQLDQVEVLKHDLKVANTKDRNSVEEAEKAVVAAKKKLVLLEERHAARNHELEISRQQMRDRLAALHVEWLSAAEAKSARQTEQQQAARRLAEMEKVPKNCPTCGKPWDAALSEEELLKARADRDRCQEALNIAAASYAALQHQRLAIDKEIKDIEDEMADEGHLADTRRLNGEVSDNDRLIRSLNARVQQRELRIVELDRGPSTVARDRAAAVVEERQRALADHAEAIQKAAADLAGEEEVLRIVEYWQKAFSPTGISNMLLSDAIGPLNRIAQRISNLMTGGTLQISYATQRELRGGDSKAQLNIRVDNRIGSKRPEGSSKGEAGLTNLIIAENLSEVGRVSQRMGFRFYDEVTTGQDAQVRRAIFSYLKEVARQQGILIFVVDHHVEASSYADYVLLAEKTLEHGTRFFWK